MVYLFSWTVLCVIILLVNAVNKSIRNITDEAILIKLILIIIYSYIKTILHDKSISLQIY